MAGEVSPGTLTPPAQALAHQEDARTVDVNADELVLLPCPHAVRELLWESHGVLGLCLASPLALCLPGGQRRVLPPNTQPAQQYSSPTLPTRATGLGGALAALGTATPVQHHSTAFPSSGGSSSPVHHIPSPTGVSELLVDTQALQLLQVPMLKTSTGWGCRQKDTEKSTPSGVVGGQAEGRGHRSRMLWEVPPGCLCSPRSRAGVPADTWAPALERKLLCSAAATLYEEGNLAGATRPQSRGSLAAGAAGSAAGLPQDPSAPRCGSGPGAVPRPSHLPLC